MNFLFHIRAAMHNIHHSSVSQAPYITHSALAARTGIFDDDAADAGFVVEFSDDDVEDSASAAVVTLAGGDGVGNRGAGIFDVNDDDLGNDAYEAGGDIGEVASTTVLLLLLLLLLTGEADLSFGRAEVVEEPFK